MRVAIIGGGASGCMTALSIKSINPKVIVDIYEKEDKILKKLAATGGGRCNLGNLDIKSKFYNHPKYINSFISSYPSDAYLKYFNDHNLAICKENNLLYPFSKKATTLIEFFKDQLNINKVNIILNFKVYDFIKNNQIVINNKVYDKLVIAIGSNALINNDVYSLVSKYFRVTKIEPSLVGFKSKMIKNMKGIRQQATVNLMRNNKVVSTEVGEIQFKDDGISGICIMNLSTKYEHGDYLEIDFLGNDINIDNSLLTTNNYFKYYFDNKLNSLILNNYKDKSISNLNDSDKEIFINKYRKFKLDIDGVYDYKFAQVCRGGISLDEVNEFKSIKYPNIYFTGEILDIDAICGGYNLWFAFNSGMKVGNDICK